MPHNQILKDVRDVTIDDFKNNEIIVYLSAISNDPLGEFNKKITNDINFIGAVEFAKKAKVSGVKKLDLFHLKVCMEYQILMMS